MWRYHTLSIRVITFHHPQIPLKDSLKLKLLTFNSVSCSFQFTIKDEQNELDFLVKGQFIDGLGSSKLHFHTLPPGTKNLDCARACYWVTCINFSCSFTPDKLSILLESKCTERDLTHTFYKRCLSVSKEKFRQAYHRPRKRQKTSIIIFKGCIT